MQDNKNLIIRSSTEEFLTFKTQEGDKEIQVRYDKDTLWMTQKAQWYVLDKERMKNGTFLNKDNFEKLLEEIRLSERRFYQKITDEQKEGKIIISIPKKKKISLEEKLKDYHEEILAKAFSWDEPVGRELW